MRSIPVFLDIPGQRDKEEGGTLRLNVFNVSAALDLTVALVTEVEGCTPRDIGIATGYAAQVDLYFASLRRVAEAFPDQDWDMVTVGTTEYWQGKEAPVMLVDFVRAENDNGKVGFMNKKQRLNVLITRQQQGLFIIEDCESVSLYRDAPPLELAQEEDPELAAQATVAEACPKKSLSALHAAYEALLDIDLAVIVPRDQLTEAYVTFSAGQPIVGREEEGDPLDDGENHEFVGDAAGGILGEYLAAPNHDQWEANADDSNLPAQADNQAEGSQSEW